MVTLSATLSNIFQNDLHSIFGDDTDPLQLTTDISLNSLSWAYDLVLMSTTHRGLQNCLKKLDNYCNRWGLVINPDKSKAMVMKRGNLYNGDSTFTLAGSQIELVNQCNRPSGKPKNGGHHYQPRGILCVL